MKPANRKNTPKPSKQTRNVSVTKTEVYQGAIPPPEMMEGYKILDNTFPNRILSMAEKEQEHSHKMDGKTHLAVLIQTSVGMLAGVITMFSLCYLVYYSITNDMENVAMSIVGSMAAIIGVFIYRYRRRNK
ncbi:MAG: DUF2335 domain-containing protein [Polaribacter sp.]